DHRETTDPGPRKLPRYHGSQCPNTKHDRLFDGNGSEPGDSRLKVSSASSVPPNKKLLEPVDDGAAILRGRDTPYPPTHKKYPRVLPFSVAHFVGEDNPDDIQIVVKARILKTRPYFHHLFRYQARIGRFWSSRESHPTAWK